MAVARQLGAQLLGSLGRVAVVDGDPVAALGEGKSGRSSDPARGPGDEDGASHGMGGLIAPPWRSRAATRPLLGATVSCTSSAGKKRRATRDDSITSDQRAPKRR